MSTTLELAKNLIARPSVTPEDHGCQDLMIERLQALDFEITRLRFGEVDNFWAQLGEATPLLAFAGHTDVVPTGPKESWDTDPFVPEIRDGMLYGRGAADMKSSLAAFITAIEDFLKDNPEPEGAIALLITSDEEGPSVDGTVKVVEWLQQQGKKIDYCVVGEPTASDKLGDTIKNGRRGSLNGVLTVHGVQGHVAYPHLATNPIHLAIPALAQLAATEWDQGNEYFPATTFQISNVYAGTGANNVIPGVLEAEFNFRFSTAVTEKQLRQRTEAVFEHHGLKYEIDWTLSGPPFVTAEAELVQAAQQAIKEVTGLKTVLSTSGGTSDGRFIAPTGAQVVEIGPLNATIHKVNECVAVDDLEQLSAIYGHIMRNLLS
ncbi:MAG: succinyl-diaminopimelate desuccinylase [Gammaproteobacteria bacterium]|nr:MAG: succinyl-diaminopimelate desuccinylase [Gammaproteobacteria bacterium]